MSAEFKFNNDLLRDERDRKNAADAYGDIFFALDHPELRRVFEPRDDAANDAKKRSRRSGVQAVALVTVALLITASIPLFEHAPDRLREALAAAGALFGVLGGYLGLSGVLFGEAKHEWLRNRYATERLRQLHFQTLLAFAPQIQRVVETGDAAPLLKARAAALARFEGDQIAHIDAKLSSVLMRDVSEPSWLLDVPFEPSTLEGAGHDLLLDAMLHLRINHQIDFAAYKLSSDRKLFSTLPFRQIKIIDGAALACVLLLLVLDVLVVVGVAAGAAPFLLTAVHVAAISFAIVALALRTLEEGLQPHREVERYRQYGSALRIIRDRFIAAGDAREKRRVLRELEDLTYWEMVSFLKSNEEARFVM